MRVAPAVLVLAFLCAPAGAGPRSIVGDWALDPKDCGTPFAFRIGPRALASDSFACAFTDVSRTGSTVRFAGVCDDGPGDKPETVTATEVDGRLSLAFRRAGGRFPDLRRCPATSR